MSEFVNFLSFQQIFEVINLLTKYVKDSFALGVFKGLSPMVGWLCCLGPVVVGMCDVTARERERKEKESSLPVPFKGTYPMAWKLPIRPGMANLDCQLATLGRGVSNNCFYQIACGHVWGVHFCIFLIAIEVGVSSPLWAGGSEQSMKGRCL